VEVAAAMTGVGLSGLGSDLAGASATGGVASVVTAMIILPQRKRNLLAMWEESK
jgi:hypothetical protein